MPKDQPFLSKLSPCASSSKNAKDKSNSTTLRAIRNSEDAVDSSGRGSCHSSEKDSGYSDGSDWQQTDVEDRQSNKSHAEPSRPGQNRELGQQKPGNPSPIPAGSQLSPNCIINNMMLKQPDMIQKRRQLPRGSISRVTGSDGAAHMILLQQPNLFLTTLQLHKPPSRKHSTTGKMTKGPYLPILNSYPRIAPHPSKKPPDKSTLNDKSQNLSKRVCTEHTSDCTVVTSSLPEQHLHKQPKLQVSASGLPRSSSTRDGLSSSSPTSVSSTQGSSSGSSLHTTSSFLSPRGLHRNNSTSTRHRRFLNTVEILRQSGLLDITLRTKELLRQSNATERDVAQLRQHTELLCQAASKPSCSRNDVAAWEHLHRTMAESGSYPDLHNLQIPCRVDSPSQTKSISTGDTSKPLAADKSEMSLSRFLTAIADPHQNCPAPQQSHSGQGRNHGRKPSKKVTFMPPDSSTG